MRITLFKKVMGHLNQLIRIVPEVFETYKPCFKSSKLRRLCSLKPIMMQPEEQEEKEEKEGAEGESGKTSEGEETKGSKGVK